MAFIGDTVRFYATFYNYSGTPSDPQSVICTVYSHIGQQVLVAGAATRESEGIYYYDFTIPDTDGALVYEFAGEYDGKPTVGRAKLEKKWV